MSDLIRSRRKSPAVQVKAAPHQRPSVRRLLAPVGSLWLVAALIAVWEVFARATPTVFFPPFSDVLVQFRKDWLSSDAGAVFLSANFYDTVPVSLGRLAVGWGAAVMVGVLVGSALGRSRLLARMYNPIVRFFMSLPNAALLPIAFAIFGAHSSMNIFLIFLGTVWLVVVSTADGVSGVDSQWIRSARSLHLAKKTFYLKVVFPAALPQIMAGLRVSVGIGLILMIISELYATTAGLGFDVVLYQQTFRYRQMWSAFLLIGLIGILLNAIMNAAEKRVLRWQRRSSLSEM